MTREEIIKAADNDFEIEAVDMKDELDFYKVYRAGIIYGQNHPKSPWIDVEDDLPNNPKYLKQPDYSPWVIAVTENGEVLPAQMIVMHEKWIWHSRFCRKHEDIVLWMPIPKFEEYLLWHEKRKLN